ncbi:MAG: RING finger protein 151-like isoform X1 [Faunusvirus sp.]|jgi:hypothetical protein|uniref:RING finger protein 151-like isoform X1 n=1 Tax=Faunusvirus sp. TaxID=2487766 RepID=A0A3G5A2X5_9VIRU|nr:MAG: RING finger protein 151-like isoform X1 [Faunusvirus sp.]
MTTIPAKPGKSGEMDVTGVSFENIIPSVPDMNDIMCLICRDVIHIPASIEYNGATCEHIFCHKCLTTYAKSKGNHICPSCNTVGQRIISIGAFARYIRNQKITCPNRKCDKIIQISEVTGHKLKCEFQEIKCDFCTESFMRTDLPQHKLVCERRQVECTKCNLYYVFCEVDKHDDAHCLYTKLKCRHANCDAEPIFRKNLLQHYQLECNYETIQCQYKCSQTFLRPDKDVHEASCEHRLVKCALCVETVKFRDKLNHDTVLCKKLVITCPFGCETKYMIENKNAHTDTCVNVVVNCKYHTVGCDYAVMRSQMPGHFQDAAQHHIVLFEQQLSKKNLIINSLHEYDNDIVTIYRINTRDIVVVSQLAHKNQYATILNCFIHKLKPVGTSQFNVGDIYDILDWHGKWYPGEIIARKELHVTVTYYGWLPRDNETLKFTSDYNRFAVLGTHKDEYKDHIAKYQSGIAEKNKELVTNTIFQST